MMQQFKSVLNVLKDVIKKKSIKAERAREKDKSFKQALNVSICMKPFFNCLFSKQIKTKQQP